MKQGVAARRGQNGLSLVGFIFVLALIAFVAVLAMKAVPSVIEYSSIKKALTTAKNAGSTPQEIRASFDKQVSAGYIESVGSKDLEIVPNQNGGFDVGVAYEKRIALVGPASLLIDYAASTGPMPEKAPEQ